ncbi:MAG: hypothetical protein ACHQUC_08580 [Chlamydiales bacterium]
MYTQFEPTVLDEYVLPKADSFLEGQEETSVSRVFVEFKSKGGKLYCLDAEHATSFQLLPGDVVFTACSSGGNRSQAVWKVLQSCNQNITIMNPHAARGGYDPYNGKLKRWRDPSIGGGGRSDGFKEWAGCDKVEKLGAEKFQEWFNKGYTPETFDEMTSYFDDQYYRTSLPTKRRVYITFGENAHVHGERLRKTNDSLHNVVVLFFSFPTDPLKCHVTKEWIAKRSGDKDSGIRAYDGLSKILQSGLDLSKVQNEEKKEVSGLLVC